MNQQTDSQMDGTPMVLQQVATGQSPTLGHPRKRISQACKPCGAKKIKCDGASPYCSPCIQRGLDCEYGISKRSTAHRNGMGSHYVRRQSQPPSSTSSPYDERLRCSNSAPRVSSKLTPELSTRLFQKYFNYIHPIWPILYKPMYASLDYRSPTQGMPAALVAAIYAIAACIDNKPQPFAPNTVVHKYSEPQAFFEEAMHFLQESNIEGSQNLSNALQPSILNCQVLTILALQQHGLAEYSCAAVLCGTAAAMAMELRLHRPDPSGNSIDQEVRSRLWWNIFILEKMISFELGKPITLRTEEADCPYPSESEADEYELMSVYVRDRGQTEQVRNTSIKFRTMSAFHTTIGLSAISERVSREIYGLRARQAIREGKIDGEATRISLWSALRDWAQNLDMSGLRMDLSDELSSVPATVINHTVMWSITIAIHRPFIARWNNNPNIPESSSDPLDICLQAANNICLILEKYIDRLPGLPCDMVFPIFTAASTLLCHSKQSQSNDGLETRRRLKLCIHWLSILGKNWKTAGARQQLLSDAFDLPDVNDVLSSSAQQTPSGQQTAQYQPVDQKNGAPGSVMTADDWSFLSEFGDPTDEFYALECDLKVLLDGDYAAGNRQFV
ncbi:fungal-specific transcription factor domain-containing protein [Calycina marina]|uniref:Fungal-specific transcription factor domain-containing protein n=1 Tax=Calycina marina TaxID=1763456 RepID=A0A9P8CJA9_9HELO|nr:fungal-specific transcription factor domain-containing protein [Calycina marina]